MKLRDFTLKITKNLIIEAARENSAKCMIARAIHEAGGTYPSVTKELISFNKDGVRYSYPTPARAAKELVRFDEGEDIQPFVVRLSRNVCSTRPVAYVPRAKVVKPKTKLDGARVIESARRKGPHRGVRRASGLRVVED